MANVSDALFNFLLSFKILFYGSQSSRRDKNTSRRMQDLSLSGITVMIIKLENKERKPKELRHQRLKRITCK